MSIAPNVALRLSGNYLARELYVTYTSYVLHAANRVCREVDAIVHQQVLHRRRHTSGRRVHARNERAGAAGTELCGILIFIHTAYLQYSDATY